MRAPRVSPPLDRGSEVRLREIVIAAAIALVVCLVAVAADPAGRETLLVSPPVHALLCHDGVTVRVSNQNGGPGLTMPDTGIHVRVTNASGPLPAELKLYVREDGSPWELRWTLDAPSGSDIFYLPVVHSGTAAYIRVVPKDTRDCPIDSRTLVPSTG